MLELAEKAVRDKKKNGEKSVRALEADVSAWKEWIAYAEKVYNSLEETLTLYDFTKEPPAPYECCPKEEFVQELAKRKARSLSAVREAELAFRRRLSESLEQYRRYVEEKSAKAALERARAEKVQELVSGFRHGDARMLIEEVSDCSVHLLLTDPPSGFLRWDILYGPKLMEIVESGFFNFKRKRNTDSSSDFLVVPRRLLINLGAVVTSSAGNLRSPPEMFLSSVTR